MSDKQKYILAGIAAFLFIQFILMPLISQRKALRVVKTIVTSWIENDSATAFKEFMSADQVPPIYDLQSYEIKSSRFYRVDGKHQAQFWVILNFSPDNVLPTGQTWICELVLDKGRWKASSFTLAN